MSFLLLGVGALHGLVLLLLFVTTLDKGWWVLPDGQMLNLWFDCSPRNGSGWVCASLDTPLQRGVQALQVSALLLSAAALGLFLLQLQAGPRGSRFLPAGGAQILAGLAAVAGAGLFAAGGGRGGHFGPCFGLAWLSGGGALASGVIYLRLRKRDRPRPPE